MLAYLTLHPGRTRAATSPRFFWPDVLDASSRASLRSAVCALRHELGEAADALLVADRDSIGLTGHSVAVDALPFERLVAEDALEAVVELCRGPLLAGFEDEWIVRLREDHHERLGELLDGSQRAADRDSDGQAALAWTRRQVTIDPFGEDAHRRLMTRLAARGDRAAALIV